MLTPPSSGRREGTRTWSIATALTSRARRSTQDDLNRIVDAAIAVGDDAIQKAQTGSINKESWTHGSSAQRKNWTSIGFKTGDWTTCDTFGAMNLG